MAAFDLDADRHIFALSRALRSGRYQPRPFRLQVITDPKTRLIAAPAIIDRVLHRAILDDIGPTYTRGFIDHSYAAEQGRGPHRAVLTYLRWTRQHRWRLSLDIQRYFPSIHRPTLLRLFAQRLRDGDTITLLGQLLDAGQQVYASPLAVSTLGLAAHPLPPDAGLPIGSYLSQYSGNLYLNGADHFIKRTLKIKSYLRYMDDFTLFSDDRAQLQAALEALTDWLLTQRHLTLNPRRTALLPTRQPSTYVGYRVSTAGLSPGKKLRRRMPQKLRHAARKGPDALERTLHSYKGILLFG